MRRSIIDRIILVGPAASGKDHARKDLINLGLTQSVSYTTRPIREGEQDGVDYHYIDDTEFNNMVSRSEFYEHQEFNGWSYGTTKKEMNNSQLFIMTPAGLADLAKIDRDKSIVIFFNIDQTIRENRLIDRGDIDNISRRIAADTEDFKSYVDWDIMIKDSEFNIVSDVIERVELRTQFKLSHKLTKTLFNEAI